MLYSVSMKHEKSEMRRKRIIFESIRTAVATLMLLAVSLLTFAWFHHARPKERMSAGLITVTPTPALVAQAEAKPDLPSTPGPSAVTDAPVATPEPTPVYVPWIDKFADQFTDTVVSDEQGYSSPDLAIHITKVQYGKAKTAMYYLADIYLVDVFQFESVLAKDRFGSGLRESVKDMGKRSGALLAITGDTYGNQDAGIVIRNGIVHRQEKSTFDIYHLVLGPAKAGHGGVQQGFRSGGDQHLPLVPAHAPAHRRLHVSRAGSRDIAGSIRPQRRHDGPLPQLGHGQVHLPGGQVDNVLPGCSQGPGLLIEAHGHGGLHLSIQRLHRFFSHLSINRLAVTSPATFNEV